MRVIDLEEAIERFIQAGQNMSKDQVIYMLNRIPTTEIVRCKDCKFNKKCTLQHYWTVDGFTEEIEYCSLGKRSEE